MGRYGGPAIYVPMACMRAQFDFVRGAGPKGMKRAMALGLMRLMSGPRMSRLLRELPLKERAKMNKTQLLATALAAASLGALLPCSARADDAPSPCASLKRIVAAMPGGLASLTPEDGKAVAQPYGDDAQCAASQGSYVCTWTPHHDAGSNADALQAVAADIASCLPQATHDQNSPGRQHFYLGEKGKRTDIVLTPAGASKLRLVISGK